MKYEERSEELLTSMAITSLQSSSLYPSHSNPFESEFKKSKINEIILKESKVEYASSHFDERLDMFTYSVPPDHIDPDEIPPSILINDFETGICMLEYDINGDLLKNLKLDDIWEYKGGKVTIVTVDNNQKNMYIGYNNGNIAHWSLEFNEFLRFFDNIHDKKIVFLKTSFDDSILFASDIKGNLTYYPTSVYAKNKDNKLIFDETDTKKNLQSLIKISYDNLYVLTIDKQGTLKVFTKTLQNKFVFLGRGHELDSTFWQKSENGRLKFVDILEISKDSKHILIGSSFQRIQIEIEILPDTIQTNHIYNLEKYHQKINNIIFSNDNNYCYITDHNGYMTQITFSLRKLKCIKNRMNYIIFNKN